jgi:aryl-alcohol dehydrogenase-like predicted oxidoreductase
MEYCTLWPGEIAVSRLGFGAAALMGRVSEGDSVRALERAFALGINYIDVARSYGYGDAERAVGRFLRGKRQRIVLATKFGIEALPSGVAKRLAKALIRPLWRAFPAVRAAAAKALAAQYRRSIFSSEALRRSLDTSLRELKTDYVDVYLLHDCTSAVFEQHELFSTLRSLVAAGKIRHYGLATDAPVILHGLSTAQPFEIAQVGFGLLDQRAGPLLRAASRRGLTRIAHGSFGGGDSNIEKLRLAIARISGEGTTSPQLKAKLSSASPDLLADIAINSVLAGTGVQVVLCSMTKKAHLEQDARVMGRDLFTDPELDYIRSRLASWGESAT